MTDDKDEAIEGALHAENEAMSVAATQMMGYTPFAMLPEFVALRTLEYHSKILKDRGISRKEAEGLMKSDMAKITQGLRGKTISMPWLGSVRFAALIQVALLIDIEPTLAIPNLWECLRRKDYESAGDALMMSSWLRLVGNAEEDRRLAMDILRMLRLGIVAPLKRVH